MKKILLLIALPFVFILTLTAQISREHADQIVIEHLGVQSSDFTIYSKDTVQVDGFTVVTSIGEVFELEYSCWVYYVHFAEKTNNKYLIVKESNGNLLEVNTKNDTSMNDPEEWRVVSFINHSVWKCTKAMNSFPPYPININLVVSFYPSIKKLVIISDMFWGAPPPDGIPIAGIYDYYIEDNGVISLTPKPFSSFFWKIYYKSEDEMKLKWGQTNSWDLSFVCLTKFNDI